MPPRRTWPKASSSPSARVISPVDGVAPSATTTIDAQRWRFSWRWRRAAHTSSMSNGFSGISTIVAPPAMPAHRAMWPAWRPMTSTTITRSWLGDVVCRRSMASTQICTAVSKPNVSSVALRSLSMVLGTPTTWASAVGR